ncbi:MAG: type II toxin-antitoxin system Phd/YefM family antitoxin [Candidatus Polarisedimenticolia bacterium]
MGQIKTVGVKELKNNLSAWLREVRRGTRVLVADRNVIIAELHEPSARYEPEKPAESLLDEWRTEGKVRGPLSGRISLPASPVHLPEGTAQRLLDEDREEKN